MITCGRCTKDAKVSGYAEAFEPRHDTVAAVRACYAAPDSAFTVALDAYLEGEAAAEARAEAAAERFFEEGTESQRMQYRWEVEQDERRAAFWGAA